MGQPTLIRSSAGPIDDRPPALSRDRGRSRRVDVRADRLTRNARQADVFPAERRDVLEQGRIDGLGFPKQSDGAFQVKRVPQRDGGDHQVKTAGAILLVSKERLRTSPNRLKNTALARANPIWPENGVLSCPTVSHNLS
jgi:hypothetical protein